MKSAVGSPVDAVFASAAACDTLNCVSEPMEPAPPTRLEPLYRQTAMVNEILLYAGSARPWRTALRPSHAGRRQAQLGGLPAGRHSLRIAIIGRGSRVVAQQRHSLLVYANPTLTRAAKGSDRDEQLRYATETVNLTYEKFLARKADFERQGCTKSPPNASDGCKKPSPYNAFDWTDDGCSPPTPDSWKKSLRRSVPAARLRLPQLR
jgi:hypothetical protein